MVDDEAGVGRRLPSGSFEEALRTHNTTAVSVAVLENHALAWAAAFGVSRAGESRLVDAETRFQAASISKPVAAVTALRLVEQGLLNLDSDVKELLGAWSVRDEFGERARVSLRELLSHTGGLTVHGFPGYRRDVPVPSVLEILDGVAPANTPAVRVVGEAPRPFVYSGGGYTVIQHLIDTVTGSYGQAASEVLSRASMAHSTFLQPNEDDVAHGHDAAGEPLPTGWVLHPELAAAGLWTTPSDLARFALALAQSFNGRTEPLLTQATTANAFAPVAEADVPPFRWIGLGFYGAGEQQHLRVGHTGGNQGYRCVLIFYPERGCGAAVMTNGDNGGLLWPEVVRAIAREHRWPRESERDA